MHTCCCSKGHCPEVLCHRKSCRRPKVDQKLYLVSYIDGGGVFATAFTAKLEKAKPDSFVVVDVREPTSNATLPPTSSSQSGKWY